jgi:hypothetical protein
MVLFDVPNGLLRILNRDLKWAGIPKKDERRRTLDVHAMRTTLGALLSKGGVAPRTAQAAMRHSGIRLTMGMYTDPKLLDVRGALGALHDLPLDTGRPSERATGTAGPFVPPFVPTEYKPSQMGTIPEKTDPAAHSEGVTEGFAVSGCPVKRKDPLTTVVNGQSKSGREDLNLRPHGPEPGIGCFTIPNRHIKSIDTANTYVNGPSCNEW